MKIHYINIILSANILIFAVLAVQMPHLMIAPGNLIAGHEDLTQDCFACHDPFSGSDTQKCISCHAVNEIGIKTSKGSFIKREKEKAAFHHKLKQEDCMECHSDHAGVNAFRGASRFSHRLLEKSLLKECAGCHENPEDSLHQKIQGNCAECHTIKAWKPASFKHEKYFRFDRDHDVKCARCHENNDYKKYTCYGCHEHSRSNIREEHLEEGIRDFENCTECHKSPDEDEAERLMRSKFGGKEDRSYQREREHDDD